MKYSLPQKFENVVSGGKFILKQIRFRNRVSGGRLLGESVVGHRSVPC